MFLLFLKAFKIIDDFYIFTIIIKSCAFKALLTYSAIKLPKTIFLSCISGINQGITSNLSLNIAVQRINKIVKEKFNIS